MWAAEAEPLLPRRRVPAAAAAFEACCRLSASLLCMLRGEASSVAARAAAGRGEGDAAGSTLHRGPTGGRHSIYTDQNTNTSLVFQLIRHWDQQLAVAPPLYPISGLTRHLLLPPTPVPAAVPLQRGCLLR